MRVGHRDVNDPYLDRGAALDWNDTCQALAKCDWYEGGILFSYFLIGDALNVHA